MKNLICLLVVFLVVGLVQEAKAQFVVDDQYFLQTTNQNDTDQVYESTAVERFTTEVTNFIKPFFTRTYWRQWFQSTTTTNVAVVNNCRRE